MKKTLITLLALAGAAAADSTTITLPENTDYTWIAGSNASGIGTGATAEIVQKLATAIGEDKVGWFAGTGQAYDAASYGADISITSSTSFTFKSRPALSGEYVALGVKLTEAADSITLTFANDKKVGYSLWSYDGTTATELVAFTGPTAAGTTTTTFDTSTIAADSTIFAIWSANPSQGEGGGAAITVSDIGLSYTAAPAAPEPATATLSLLALAGLAARRRRS